MTHKNSECPVGACPQCLAEVADTPSKYSAWLTASAAKLRAAMRPRVFRTTTTEREQSHPDAYAPLGRPVSQGLPDQRTLDQRTQVPSPPLPCPCQNRQQSIDDYNRKRSGVTK